MTPASFIKFIKKKSPPATESEVVAFERMINGKLPADYRDFLLACNGGYVGGRLWFMEPTPTGKIADAGVHHIGGVRAERHLSLRAAFDCYANRIPQDLIWIMDDPFGNAICLAFRGPHRGRVFFWDHEHEAPKNGGLTIEGAGNLQLLANSFSEFVCGLRSGS